MVFRHEWKHEIGAGDVLALRARLRAVMELDPHAAGGGYAVRSLYFDNLRDKALREKIDGVDRREKFRLRLYNGDTGVILLEKKRKVSGLCRKEQARLDVPLAQAVLAGDFQAMGASGLGLVQELAHKMKAQGLAPKTLVDYWREPFIFRPGNVRVTLDYHIRTGMRSVDFLNPGCVTIPAGDAPAILEVKWDGFLPEAVRMAVQTPGTHTGAFSKYAACRVYG